MDDTKYDGTLLEILSSCGRPERFLDVVFGFLYRRSDFYEAAPSPQAPRGLPPGYAVKITHMAFQKYYKLAQAEAKKGLLEPAMKANDPVSEVAREEVVDIGAEQKDALGPATKAKPPVAEVASEEVVDIGGEQVTLQHRGDEIVVQAEGVSAKEATAKLNVGGPQKNSSDSFNGADRDNYSWTQTHDDIDVRVKITKDQRKFVVSCAGGRKLKVTALEKNVPVTLVEGDLLHKVKESETVWTSSPGEFIHISLEKVDNKWWDSLLMNEVKISLSELEVTKSFDELDPEEQMKIRQLQQENIDKLKGKLDTKKQNIEETLKKAWNLEGSPFKGTPYDPSVVNMDFATGDLNLRLP